MDMQEEEEVDIQEEEVVAMVEGPMEVLVEVEEFGISAYTYK